MKQKTVLITGSSRGIGKEAALTFSRNGYHVFLNGRTPSCSLSSLEEQIKAEGMGSCQIIAGDVSDEKQVKDMFATIAKERRGLDMLINNAGVSHIGLLSDMTFPQWNQLLSTNLSSAFYCCHEAIPYMVQQKQGCIINVSSMWGLTGASCEVAYSASKAGLIGFSKALAKELAPSHIKVTAIAFGVIDTAMNECFSKEERSALADEIPTGRFATAKEAGEFIYQIAHLPEYMTGQVIRFDGAYL